MPGRDGFETARTSDPDRISSLGIGLYVVQESVTLHRERVEVERSGAIGRSVPVRIRRAALTHR
jgi:signal transduction histidine kinase